MVTVVIITRDRARDLRVTLDRLKALPEQPPVIVVDNASSDATRAVVAAAGPTVEGIHVARNAGAAGRNLGVARAATPLVAFCDDDSCWQEGALALAEQIFARHPRLGLLAATILVASRRTIDPVCCEMQASPLPRERDLPGPSVLGFLACGAIVRRAAFLEAGGFDERLGVGGEETLLAIDLARRGWGLAYCAEVIAHHYPADGGARPGREARMVRNVLWTVWLRYRARDALAVTARVLGRALHCETTRAGLGAAVAGLPWVLRERAPVGAPLQRQLARIGVAA
jgi:GT2 family glycosyltransferase